MLVKGSLKDHGRRKWINVSGNTIPDIVIVASFNNNLVSFRGNFSVETLHFTSSLLIVTGNLYHDGVSPNSITFDAPMGRQRSLCAFFFVRTTLNALFDDA